MQIQTDSSFDVAVLGSGLSGSLVATLLASQGVRVVLVDARTHPRFAIGESTIPHTSILLSILAEQYGVPEIDHLAYPDRIAEHVCTTCGIKRSFGFAYHREGQPYDRAEALQFGTSSKDENHLFRQDVDAYLFYTALRYGVTARQNTLVTEVAIDDQGATLRVEGGHDLRARYVIDAMGFGSLLSRQYALKLRPTPLHHHSRSLFTHMIDVAPFDADGSPMLLPWHQSTLHHVFEGGWLWVIPFNNRAGSTNPLVSVGLTLDPRRYPRPDGPPEDEFRAFLRRFPAIARSFAQARAVRPWVSTGRIQHATRQTTGYRYALMSHAAGFVDPLFSRGLINTLEVIAALLPPLLHALRTDDFAPDAFTGVDTLQRRVIDYNDRLVHGAFVSWDDFDLWNAWLRVWALGTILAEYRVMNALTDFTATRDPIHLRGEAAAPVFSNFEDPDYAAFFARAYPLVAAYAEGMMPAAEAAERLFALPQGFAFPVPLRRDAMRRAGWLGADDVMSDRNLRFAREGYRWAITNPTSRDLFGNTDTFFRWRARQPDPHVTH